MTRLPSKPGASLVKRAVGVDGEGDGGVDAALAQLGLVGHPDVEVVAAVAGRGVHEARAVLVGDVVAVEEGDVEVVARHAAQRMRADASRKSRLVTSAERSNALDLGRLHHGFGKLVGQDELVAGLGPVAVGRLRDLVKAVIDLRVEAIARLPGIVQGVVVQMTTDAPCRASSTRISAFAASTAR